MMWIPPLLEPWEGERRAAPAAGVEVAWKPAELDPRPLAPPKPRDESEEAFTRGYTEGVRDGSGRAESRVEPALAALRGMTERIAADRERHARERGRDVQALALAVARHLVMRTVATDPAVLTDLVTRALELMPGDAPIEVRVSLADLEALSGSIERLSGAGAPGLLRWVADPELERGSFVLDSPARLIDGRVDMALRAVFEAFERD